MSILGKFLAAYPRPGLEVVHGFLLVLHGTTIAEDCGRNRIAIKYIPESNPEYKEEIKAISWMLGGFLAFENDQTVMTISQPAFGKWYWLNGPYSGEEV